MPKFAKVEPQVDFPALERDILKWWDDIHAFDKLRRKNQSKPKWSFLDGPITANNPMGVHHAWGRTYKDAFQRYFAMTGREERYQNGFDCQGLWVEVEVEKELKLQSKRDIENLVPGDRFASIDKFVALCKERVDKFARIQTEQSIRLGMWMNWDRTDEDWAKSPDERKSYFTMSEENNYTIWAFLKKCHERKLVYRGFDSMPWCPRCGVGLSEMEVKEGYKQVTHRSVFIRFKLRDRANEYLLVWTTTPWTLSSNVGAAVNPELTYLKVKHKGDTYYVGKTAFSASRSGDDVAADDVEVDVEGVSRDAKRSVPRLKSIEQLFKEKGKEGFEIAGEVTGADMVGWAYDGPFDELPGQQHPSGFPEELAHVVRRQNWAPDVSSKDAHRVVAWKDVGATTGTGIVHIAPGCGKEDFQLGKEQGLPPIAPLDEAGVFLPGFGELTGKSAVDPATADFIIDRLKEKGVLFAPEQYPHSYPHCWRCKTELLFRLVDEWFIDMKWRGEIMDVTRQVEFLPESIGGKARELKWLEQMHDWMISKKRFWGLALPIWVCEECQKFDVVGGRDELKQRAIEGWTEFDGHTPHRPWVDKVKLRCDCGGAMSRIPDVGNPWLDAGIVPYSTVRYNKDRAYWEKWFPADFITESFPGQFRNWFYAILAMSTMMTNRPPFKVLLGHALVRDEHGETMSKSKGNAIEFNEAADKMGADVMRWLYCRTNPAQNINFGYGPANELRAKFHLKLWNSYAFFVNYARLDGFDPSRSQVPIDKRPDIDRWILSDLQLLIQAARVSFEAYDLQKFCLEAERFVDDKLSNWYIRRNRRRFWKSEKGTDKDAAYQTLYEVLTTLTKLIAPVVPFLAEVMWQNLRMDKGPESIHLCGYPTADEKLIDQQLSAGMELVFRIVALGSAVRNHAKTKIRQPLSEMKVAGGWAEQRVVDRFGGLVCEELNIKKLAFIDPNELREHLNIEYKPDPKVLGPTHGRHLREIGEALDRLNAEGRRLSGEWDFIAKQGEVDLEVNGQVMKLPDAGIKTHVTPKRDSVFAGWLYELSHGVEVLLDLRITDELKLEGYAREVVRHVQELRKKTNLEMEDRIAVSLTSESAELSRAIDAHRDYISAECLVREWATQLPNGATAEAKIEGQALSIALRKV